MAPKGTVRLSGDRVTDAAGTSTVSTPTPTATPRPVESMRSLVVSDADHCAPVVGTWSWASLVAVAWKRTVSPRSTRVGGLESETLITFGGRATMMASPSTPSTTARIVPWPYQCELTLPAVSTPNTPVLRDVQTG